MKQQIQAEKFPQFLKANYELIEFIGEGRFSFVYKAKILSTGQYVAIKVPNVQVWSEVERSRVLTEAMYLASVQSPNIVDLISIEEEGRDIALVLEFLEGMTLRDLLLQGALEPNLVLNIAKQLLTAAHHLHSNDLIHCDLKPENLFWSANGRLVVFDLGLGSQASEQISDSFGGTYYYASPEQMGITNVPFDHRTDLYAIGAILYELASQKHTTNAKTLLELSDWHSSGQLPDFEILNLPEQLKKLIVQLLSKDPENRPSSALGAIKIVDPKTELEIPVGAVGRTQELKSMFQTYSKSATGYILLTGPPGVGKTTMLNEFLARFNSNEVVTLNAKGQMSVRLPLSAITQWFDSALRLSHFEAAFLELLLTPEGRYQASILSQVFSNLKNFLSRQISIANSKFTNIKIESVVNFNQLEIFDAILAIFRNLGEKKKLFLTIDDLQWIDDETLTFLLHISAQLKNLNLFLLLNQREDNSKKNFLDQLKLTSIAKANLELKIEAMTTEASDMVIGRSLGQRAIDVDLRDWILERGEGNPLVMAEYLRTLKKDHRIRFFRGNWTKRFSSVDELAKISIGENLIELFTSRINQLNEFTRRYLQVASLVGSKFEATVVNSVLAYTEEQGRRSIQEGIKAKLIESAGGLECVFCHDRIQESLQKMIVESECEKIHAKISQSMLRQGLEGREFEVAEHMLRARDTAEKQERNKVLLQAGYLALKSHLNSDGLKYLEQALIDESSNRQDSNFLSSMAELYFRLHHPDKAQKYYAQAYPLKKDLFSKAELRLAFAKVILSRAEGTPLHTIIDGVPFGFSVIEKLKFILHSMAIGKFKRVMQILSSDSAMAAHFCYHDIKIIEAAYLTFTAFIYASLGGPSRELAKATSQFGLIFSNMGIESLARFFTNRAVQMTAQFFDRRIRGECESFSAISYQFLGHAKKTQNLSESVLIEYSPYLLTIDLMNLSFSIIWSYVMTGKMDKAREKLNFLTEKLSKTSTPEQEFFFALTELFIDSAADKKINIEEAIKNIELKVDKPIKGNPYRAGSLITSEIFALIWSDQCSLHRILELKNRFQEECGLKPFVTTVIPPALFYLALPHALIRLSEITTGTDREVVLRELKTAIMSLNFGRSSVYWQVHQAFLRGAYDFHKREFDLSLKHLSHAESLATEHGMDWIVAESYRYKGLILERRGEFAQAQIMIQGALQLITDNGFFALAHRVRENLKSLRLQNKNVETISMQQSIGMGVDSALKNDLRYNLEHRKLEAISHLSLALSKATDIKEQQLYALENVVASLSAERGFLFEYNEKNGVLKLKIGMHRSGSPLHHFDDASSSVINRVVKTREAVLIGDRAIEESLSTSVLVKNIRSGIATPLLIGDRMLGVLYCDNRIARGMFSESDMSLLQAMGNQIAFGWDLAKSAEVLMQKKEIERDLAISTFVQSLLLPKVREKNTEKYKYSIHYQSATQSGGDWVWVDEFDNNLLLFIGDISGHGIGSAMVTALVAGAFEISRIANKDPGLAATIKDVHDVLFETCQSEFSMSASAFQFDFENHSLKVGSHGFPEFILLRDGVVSSFGSGGTLLGLQHFESENLEVKFQKGDLFLIFTDGLFEMKNAEGVDFGTSKLRRYLNSLKANSLEQLREALLSKLAAWRGDTSLHDDLTFLIIEIIN